MLMIQDGGDLAKVDYSSETQRAVSLITRLMTSSQSMRTDDDNRFRRQSSPFPRITNI